MGRILQLHRGYVQPMFALKVAYLDALAVENACRLRRELDIKPAIADESH